jgi:hypothetical protein
MTRRYEMAHALAACWLLATTPLAALELVVPVDCQVGRECFIQQHMDHDPSAGARDYACGPVTYDGHDGTDFRLRTTREAQEGVAVLAAADGVVAARRDGVPDRLAKTPEDLRAVATRECGNGAVIDHGDGWETQYCHLRRGSLAVEAGDQVAAGERIGEIGYSGAAAFPHLHLSVRRDGEPVDPFLGLEGDPDTCGADAEPLWAGTAELDYRAGRLLDMGFAAGPVELRAVETGTVERPRGGAPAMVAWGWAINLQAGDDVAVVLAGPDGGELARNATTLDRNKAQHMLFAGVRQPPAGWPAGRYTAAFSVSRAGEAVIDEERVLVVE